MEPLGELQSLPLPLEAQCTAQVRGRGEVLIESDYLPRVVACENGAAPPAALRAQAISARGYLYYKLGQDGFITDGTEDQVYSCAQAPLDQHYEAVEATRGTILGYRGTTVAAFYVAGAIPSAPDCRPQVGDPDRSNTERYVTYNEGQSGDEVFQSPLGFVHPENLANRGCASQNGASCLASRGRDHEAILRFYYGEDIELVVLEGCESDLAPRGPGSEAGSRTSEGALGCRHVETSSAGSVWTALLFAALAAVVRRRGAA